MRPVSERTESKVAESVERAGDSARAFSQSLQDRLRPQKITMLIEVVPGPRLDIVSEPAHKMPEGRGPVNDGLLLKAVNDATSNVEHQASCLAFNVSPEDLFLLDRESMESLLSGSQKTVVVNLASRRADAASDSKGDAEQQDRTKIRLTFIPVLQHTELVHDGIRREENNRHDDTDCYTISERLFKKLKKWFHKALKAHGR